jgi:hypothetical protein
MSSLKFNAPLAFDLGLRERARREGRTLSDVILRAVQRGLAPDDGAMPDAIIDKVERSGRGNTSAAAYLSGPIASAVRQLSQQQRRSQSWTVRYLLRCELRRRGLLPTPPSEQDDGDEGAWRSRKHDAADARRIVNSTSASITNANGVG